MATKPKSYKKNGYTYTESSPGSNKFQNFTAKPTVKNVRDESRKDKEKVAVKKSTSKPGESKMARDEATRKVSRMGGMDTGNVMKTKSSTSSIERKPYAYSGEEYRRTVTEGKSQRYRPAPAKKSIVGSIVDRVTQPPRKLTPASEKMLAEARAEITPVVTALAGGRLLYKGGKKLIEAGAKYFGKPKPSGAYRGTTSKYVPKKVKFPKAVKGRKLTGSGTYTAN